MSTKPAHSSKQANLFEGASARVLKKHVATVHSSVPLTVKERICVNVLLANAMTSDGAFEKDDKRHRQHKIEVEELVRVVFREWQSRRRIREVLNGLLNKIVEWNYISEDLKEDWGASTWLAGYKFDGKTLYYSYSVEIIDKILDPNVFARINYSVQNRLDRKQSLSLYENCARYRDIGRTKAWTLDTFRSLMGVAGRYPEFKTLNRDVIKASIAEINEKTEIYVEPVIKKKGNEILAIQFVVKENTSYDGPPMPGLATLDLDADLIEGRIKTFEACQSFGIDRRQTMVLLEQYDDDYILENLLIVAERIRIGKTHVRQPAAYAVNALRQDYRAPAVDHDEIAAMSKAEEKVANGRNLDAEKARRQLSEFENNKFPRWRYDKWHEQASKNHIEQAWDEFYDQQVAPSAMLMRLYKQDREGGILTAHWRVFARKNYMPNPTDNEREECAAELGLPLSLLREKAHLLNDKQVD